MFSQPVLRVETLSGGLRQWEMRTEPQVITQQPRLDVRNRLDLTGRLEVSAADVEREVSYDWVVRDDFLHLTLQAAEIPEHVAEVVRLRRVGRRGVLRGDPEGQELDDVLPTETRLGA